MVGRVVVVVVRGVVVVVVGLAAADELDEEPPVGAGVVAAEVDELVLDVVAEAEWTVVSVAARIPSPTALAEAAMATAAVIRRTRDIARSRARIAG